MAQEKDTNDEEIEDHDNDHGWVDEVGILTPRERDNLEVLIQPIKMMLVKVRCHAAHLWT